MRSILIAIGLLALAACGGAVYFWHSTQGERLSISLSGLAPSYKDIALHFLGEPAGLEAFVSDRRPLCFSERIREQLFGSKEAAVCLPYQPPEVPCNPVVEDAQIPREVSPGNDLLLINLAIATSDAAGLASSIEVSADVAAQQIGRLRGGLGGVVSQRRRATSLQCDGYGYIFIEQHYFEK